MVEDPMRVIVPLPPLEKPPSLPVPPEPPELPSPPDPPPPPPLPSPSQTKNYMIEQKWSNTLKTKVSSLYE